MDELLDLVEQYDKSYRAAKAIGGRAVAVRDRLFPVGSFVLVGGKAGVVRRSGDYPGAVVVEFEHGNRFIHSVRDLVRTVEAPSWFGKDQ